MHRNEKIKQLNELKEKVADNPKLKKAVDEKLKYIDKPIYKTK